MGYVAPLEYNTARPWCIQTRTSQNGLHVALIMEKLILRWAHMRKLITERGIIVMRQWFLVKNLSYWQFYVCLHATY